MALRLHQTTNIIPTVYELRDQPTVRGGAVIIQPNGLRLFHRLGLYDAMCQRGFAAENLNLHSIQGQRIPVWLSGRYTFQDAKDKPDKFFVSPDSSLEYHVPR